MWADIACTWCYIGASRLDIAVDVASKVGMSEEQSSEAVRRVGSAAVDALRSGVHLAAVRADERRASTLGITSGPFLLLNDRYARQGAQSVEAIQQSLVRAGGE